MLDNIKRAFKHTSIYGLGNISAKLIGIVLLPLYTKHISVSDFGVYGFFEIILQLMPIIALGIPFSLQRWIGLKEFEHKTGEILFTSFAFLAAYLSVLFLLMIPFASFFSNLVFDTPQYASIMYIIYVIIFFQVLTRVALILLRMEEKSVYYGITNTIKILVHMGVIIYLIAFRGMGFISIFWGELFSTILLFLILMPYLFRRFRFKLELKEIKAMIKFGIPSLFGNYGIKFFNLADRNMITVYGSEVAAGIYVLGYKVANIIGNLVINSFNIAFPALAWPQVGTSNENRFFSKMNTYFAFILIWMTLGLIVYGEGILHKFAQSKEYWDAFGVIPFVATGLVFHGITGILTFGILIPQKTDKIPWITGASLAVNVSLNFLLIPQFLFIGTAIANMTTYIFRALLTYYYSVRYYTIRWEWRKIVIMFLVAGGLYGVTLLVGEVGFWLRIVYKGAILLSFPGWLYLFGFFEAIELQTLKNMLGGNNKQDSGGR